MIFATNTIFSLHIKYIVNNSQGLGLLSIVYGTNQGIYEKVHSLIKGQNSVEKLGIRATTHILDRNTPGL